MEADIKFNCNKCKDKKFMIVMNGIGEYAFFPCPECNKECNFLNGKVVAKYDKDRQWT